MIGHVVGSYVIHRELGRGGMGAVYEATHSLLGRSAAVKVLLPQFSQRRDIVQRFFNEARATTAIRHPGIVEVYDFGWAFDGSAFLVMELLEGEPLSARLLRHGRVAPVFALHVARQMASALAAAHRAGIIHRDLKPDNVFLVPDEDAPIGERVKLLDFGIAKLADGDGATWRTMRDAILGTPEYMSPEQGRGAQIDHRSDLYSLGCILFEMCCGRRPFDGAGAVDVIGAHIHDAPTRPRSLVRDLQPEVEALILRLLAKRPEDRYASAEQLARDIARLAARHEVASRATTAMPALMLPLPAPAEVVALPEPRGRRRRAAGTTLQGAAGEQAHAPEPPRHRARTVLAGAAVLVASAAATLALVPRSSRESALEPEPALVIEPDAAPPPDAAYPPASGASR